MARNVPLFLAFRATTRALLFAPYIQFFMVEVRDLSDAQYGLLQGLYYIGVVVCEVPSGVLADRLGRKSILILGAVINGAGCWIFASAHSFGWFAAGEICFALGTAFISGADSALLYDSLAAEGRQADYPRAEGAAQASWLLVTALGLPLADAFLVRDEDPVLTYWITGVLSFIGATAALWLREPPVQKRLSTREITFGALRDVVRVPGILRLVVYSIGVFALLRSAIVMFFHPALEDMGVPINFYGTVLAVVNVAGAIAAWRASGWLQRFGERSLLVGMPMTLLVMFFGLTQVKIPAGAAFFCIQGAVFGIYPLVTRSILNRLVPSPTRRATTLSIESLACRLAFGPLAFFAGWARGAFDVDQALSATALLACLPFVVLPFIPAARNRGETV